MKNKLTGRRGSALLIVLGMISFMIVSAVAFSVYMRMSRAPSSYLRRSVATQHLMKAALARAIEEIDDCIGNDPYPGVGRNASTNEIQDYYTDDGLLYRGIADAWRERVFCPNSNANGDTEWAKSGDDDDEGKKLYEFSETVSVLTLEGLGYIPASLVNNVRYWSRRTSTAHWKPFNYDLGRWAYVAVNVSDFFDVNTVHAYTNRNSGAFGRISLTPLIKNAGWTEQSDQKKFEEMLENPGGDNIPLTSVMDLNLALYKEFRDKDVSPFCTWIDNSNARLFYKNAAQGEKLRHLPLVADAWYPSTNQFARAGTSNSGNDPYILSHHGDQPFLKFDYNNGLMDIIGEKNRGESYYLFERLLKAAGSACLYDYLDRDSVPLSLALPCTEQVPMIFGITPLIHQGLKFTVERGDPQDGDSGGDPQAADYWVEKLTTYRIKFDPSKLFLNASLIFPFKRVYDKSRAEYSHLNDGDANAVLKFKVQALVRLYLGEADMPLRLTESDSPLRPNMSSAWVEGARYEDGIYTFVSPQRDISPGDIGAGNFDEGNSEEAILDDVELEIPMPFQGDSSGNPLLVVAKKEYPNASNRSGNSGGDQPVVKEFAWLPYWRTGKMAEWNKESGAFQDAPDVRESNGIKTVRPHIAIWVRVVNEEGKTVDLAPATFQDDRLNGVNTDGAMWKDILSDQLANCGKGIPFFDFPFKDGEFEIPITPAEILSDATGVFGGSMADGSASAQQKIEKVANLATDYTSLFCYDPRYNFAPECWYAEPGGYDADKWIADVKSKFLGKDGRDSDVFMFVSNQEYLQSIGELAFLPRVNVNRDSDSDGDFFDAGRYKGNRLTFARNIDNGQERIGFEKSFADSANGGFFWRTYRSYDYTDDHLSDGLYYLTDDNGRRIYDDDGSGPRVNPYSDDPYILLAALGNTPYDYWAASTNISLGSTYANQFANSPDDALKHSFSADSNLAKISDDEIQKIADVISGRMKQQNNGDWLAAYDDLDWHGLCGGNAPNPRCFLNSDGDTKSDPNISSTAINEVDRKFLYSFWRSCFGNRQQLFIVFVRAEPSSVGGVQQGGRAVALVWRDPEPPAGYANVRTNRRRNSSLPPHRTRILFYHQFD